MKKLFYLGALGLVLFEIAKVYFIMPMPGSQAMDSLPIAYFFHQWRWVFRVVFGLLLLAGIVPALRSPRWGRVAAVVMLAVVGGITYLFNVEMTADQMFLPPTLRLADAQANVVPADKLVIGFTDATGAATAYPIQYIGYHHQVRDQVGTTPVMVTYCNVCRTGRVFSPLLEGKPEQFRLVGMDHFNAMFEDVGTGSWWRQVSGEAVAGPLRGAQLTELPSRQTTLREWLALYPGSQIMQPDSAFAIDYADMDSYDVGLGRGPLTGTDTLSWQEKSWIVGLQLNTRAAKAYDWNRLKSERVIHDTIAGQPVLVVLATDGQGFFAFQRPHPTAVFALQGDTLVSAGQAWRLTGQAITATTDNLAQLPAYQEFWHSWRTFHPYTTRY